MPVSPSDYRTARRAAAIRHTVEALVDELERRGAEIDRRLAEVEETVKREPEPQ